LVDRVENPGPYILLNFKILYFLGVMIELPLPRLRSRPLVEKKVHGFDTLEVVANLSTMFSILLKSLRFRPTSRNTSRISAFLFYAMVSDSLGDLRLGINFHYMLELID
jgi:hypothetical protein